MLEVIAPVLKLPMQEPSPIDQVCKIDLTHAFQLTRPEGELVTLARAVNTGDNLSEALCLFVTSKSKVSFNSTRHFVGHYPVSLYVRFTTCSMDRY